MDVDLAQTFFDECKKTFAFLVKAHEFTPPTLEIDPTIHFATVTFMGRNLALECIFDERENWVEFKVARVVDGVKTLEYAVDQKGNRVRDSLFSMLQRRGVREFGLKSQDLATQEVREMFRIKLAAYASLLQKYGKDILDDSPNALAV
jgi:hypothetical protein